MKAPIEPRPVQGEGDYNAARRHRKSLTDFVASGKVDRAARDAEPKTVLEQDALLEAEKLGESRSKGEDPSPPRSPARKQPSKR